MAALEVGGWLTPDCSVHQWTCSGTFPSLQSLCDQEAMPRLPGSRLGPSLFWGPTHPYPTCPLALRSTSLLAVTGITRSSISQPNGQRHPGMGGGAHPLLSPSQQAASVGGRGNATSLVPGLFPGDERAVEPEHEERLRNSGGRCPSTGPALKPGARKTQAAAFPELTLTTHRLSHAPACRSRAPPRSDDGWPGKDT